MSIEDSLYQEIKSLFDSAPETLLSKLKEKAIRDWDELGSRTGLRHSLI